MSSSTRTMAKSAANVSIRRDILEAARSSKINLSATLEHALIEILRETEQRRWRAENREAISVYNEQVERNGVFSNGSRAF